MWERGGGDGEGEGGEGGAREGRGEGEEGERERRGVRGEGERGEGGKRINDKRYYHYLLLEVCFVEWNKLFTFLYIAIFSFNTGFPWAS